MTGKFDVIFIYYNYMRIFYDIDILTKSKLTT